MKTLQDYIKLAEEADDSACHVINAMAEKYPLGADFERYNDDIRKMVDFCSDERTIAMAKALIEAEQLILAASTMLSKPRMTGRENEEMDMAKSMLDEALSQIQALNGGEDDKQR